MTLNLINSNIKEIKILSTNGIDQNMAILLDNERQREGKHEYYPE